jgi:hypothetical protein
MNVCDANIDTGLGYQEENSDECTAPRWYFAHSPESGNSCSKQRATPEKFSTLELACIHHTIVKNAVAGIIHTTQKKIK